MIATHHSSCMHPLRRRSRNPPSPQVTVYDLPRSDAARKKLLVAYSRIVRTLMRNPFAEPCVIDLGASKPNWMYNRSPCLTKSRKYGFWVTCRGRFQSIQERLRLMGLSPQRVDLSAVSEGQLGGMIGNSMAVNVLERILIRALPAVGLAEPKDMPRRWESLRSAAKTTVQTMTSPGPGCA